MYRRIESQLILSTRQTCFGNDPTYVLNNIFFFLFFFEKLKVNEREVLKREKMVSLSKSHLWHSAQVVSSCGLLFLNVWPGMLQHEFLKCWDDENSISYDSNVGKILWRCQVLPGSIQNIQIYQILLILISLSQFLILKLGRGTMTLFTCLREDKCLNCAGRWTHWEVSSENMAPHF